MPESLKSQIESTESLYYVPFLDMNPFVFLVYLYLTIFKSCVDVFSSFECCVVRVFVCMCVF